MLITSETRGAHRGARRSVIPKAIAIVCCCLIGLLLQRQQQVACQATSNQLKPNYVFPQNHQRLPSQPQSQLQAANGVQHQHQHQQRAIYFNPNPSTRTTGFHQQMQQRHRARGNQTKRAVAIGGPASHTSSSAASAAATATAGQMAPATRQNSAPLVNAASIGQAKQVLSQEADWPFFKSLQTVRKTNVDRYQNANEGFRARKAAAYMQTTAAPPTVVMFGAEQSSSSGQPGESTVAPTTTPAPATTVAMTTTTTMGEMYSTTSADQESTSRALSLSQDMVSNSDQSTDAAANRDERGNDLTTTTTMALSSMGSSQTATTEQPQASPTTSITTTTTTTMAPRILPPMSTTSQDTLFSPNFHSSIQEAINRIVKMTTETTGSKLSTLAMASETSRPTARPTSTDTSSSSGNRGTRSSLSLNVLLKNFGVHNLTNLDQILLKSTLRNDLMLAKNSRGSQIVDDNSQLSPNDQKIEIIGLHNLHQPKVVSSELSNGNDDQMAECKIEYTMKHVNISLMNGGRGDYTCDYIIDRKLATNGKPAGTKLDITKVCRLQLKSKFFSDLVEESKSLESEPNNCNGTYLAVGILRFCYLKPRSGQDGIDLGEKTLNRVFDFPIERDLFDIRMVHKKTTTTFRKANGDDEAEIHLEIRPLADKDCSNQSIRPLPGSRNDEDKSLTASLIESDDSSSLSWPNSNNNNVIQKMDPKKQSGMTNGHKRPNEVGVEYELTSSVAAQDKPYQQKQQSGSTLSLTAAVTDDSNSPSRQQQQASTSTTTSSRIDRDEDSSTSTIAVEATTGGNFSEATSIEHREPRDRDYDRNNSNSQRQSVSGDQLAANAVSPRDSHISRPNQPKRKFAFKLPHDKQLDALNNRFKVSQSFDVTSAPRHYSAQFSLGSGANRGKLDDDEEDGTRPIRGQRLANNELCDGFEHISTVGQLMSPDYPRYYAANVNCSFIIKQAAASFCQLILHFRDFDLINTAEQQRADSQHCPHDYLQVGETRYCNKYAMIGHKIRLNFPQNIIGGAAVSLSFISDHMRSGRGFLIKYQQVPCSSLESDGSGNTGAVRENSSGSQAARDLSSPGQRGRQQQFHPSTALVGDLLGPHRVDGHTIAPPMQQPDFSLALKTTPSSLSPHAQQSGAANQSSRNETNKTSSIVSANVKSIQMGTSSAETPTKETLSQVKFNEKIVGSTTGGGNKRNRLDVNSTATTTAQQLMTMSATVSSPSLASFSQQPVEQNVTNLDFNFGSQSAPNNQQSIECNQCLYYVRRNTSQVCYLELTFIKFDLEADADCRYDYLEINNIRLCGSLKDLPHKTTRIYFFNEPIKVLKFKSDDSGSKSGFLIRIDQLKCGSSGAILRQSKELEAGEFDTTSPKSGSSVVSQPLELQHGVELGLHSFNNNSQQDGPNFKEFAPNNPVIVQRTSSLNSSRTFEYDSSILASQWPIRGRFRAQPIVQSSASLPQSLPSQTSLSNIGQTSADNCGSLFEGNEVTIKSPLWPESYTNDETLTNCRYTIVRNQASKNKICQLELRFVSLRLDVSDCIDVDGYEVLCGFNTRNMVKYYPFDRQSHMTITFFTGAGKFARSLGASQQHQQARPRSSDLLPSRAPFRFMIKAKQHECIDGFLAPQVESSPSADITGSYNRTNLLYSAGSSESRYANRTSSSPSQIGFDSLRASAETSGASSRKKLSSGKSDSLLNYDFSNTTPLTSADITKSHGGSQRASTSSASPTLMHSLAGGQSTTTNGSNSDNVSFSASANGCLDGSITQTSDQLFSANYPLKYGVNSHCALTISRESVSICHLELEFLDMDLESMQSRFCESEYFQINYGERYCNMDQVETHLGPKRRLLIPFERANDNKVVILFHSDSLNSRARGFLIRHRQVPCSSNNLLSGSPSGAKATTAQKHHHLSDPAPEPKLIDRMSLLSGGSYMKQLYGDNANAAVNFDQTLGSSDQLRCLIQFGQYNGILSSSNILSKLKTYFPFRNECEVKFKLLPGFCQIQLTFGEFELTPRLSISDYCLEFLELNGVQYCGDELKNASRLLSISDMSQRTVNIRYVSSNSSYFNGFRAIFKQKECQPEPLKVLTSGSDNQQKQQQHGDQGKQVLTVKSSVQMQQTGSIGNLSAAEPTDSGRIGQQQQQQRQQQVDFKEIVLRNEFFELNSFKLSKSANAYDANMFVVYKIKKISPDVCKLRLMFYKFDLETSLGCKRDFLDVNNVDRLCGQLGRPEETRRDYDWRNERDFLISFVSDASLEREGFLLFGQQLHSNCSMQSIGQQQQHSVATQPTFDEAIEQPKTSPEMSIAQPAPVSVKLDHHRQHDADGSSKQVPTSKEEEASEKSSESSAPISDANCYKLFYEPKFELSSPNWPQKYNPKTTCYYLIHRLDSQQQQQGNCSSNGSSVTFNVVSMILGPDEIEPSEQCDTSGSKDYLDIDGQVLCGLISKPRVLNVDFGQRQFIKVKFNSGSSAGFGFFIEAKQSTNSKCSAGEQAQSQSSQRQGQVGSSGDQKPRTSSTGASESSQRATVGGLHQGNAHSSMAEHLPADRPSSSGDQQQSAATASCNQLLNDEINLIESENFPLHYPHNRDCLYALRRTNQSVCAIDIIMNHFDLEEQSQSSGSCENDYIEIDYSRFCGSYPQRHRLRFNYFHDELDKYIKFHSDASVAKSGFSLVVRQVSKCDGILSHAAPPGRQDEALAVKLAPTTSGSGAGATGDNDEVINYLPDSSTATTYSAAGKPTTPQPALALASSTNRSSLANDADDELSVAAMKEFSTLCQFVYHRERQYLVSPNYNEHRQTYDNNIDCVYKISAKGYEFCSLRLTILDLDLEMTSECQNDYLLIDNRRYCSASSNRSNKTTGEHEVVEIPFADTLPREIHLLYHTNAHVNEGRGFRLLYEQLPCRRDEDSQSGGSSSASSHFKLQGAHEGESQAAPVHSSGASSSGPDEREARRMRMGQLSYPRNYVTSPNSSGRAAGSIASSKRAHHHHRQQQQANNNNQPGAMLELAHHRDSYRRQPAVTKEHQQPQQQQANHRLEDLDQQHDDLTLRKEIVVAKSAPLIMVH